MPRGGRRQGTPGKAYGNRSDLNNPSVPSAVAQFKGQQYGANKEQIDAAQAVPPGPPGSAAGGPQGPGGPVTPPGPPPGSLGQFGRPTDRPGEPITSGLGRGPGAGPEALGALGADPSDVDLRQMAIYLPMLEALASQPGSSVTTRNFVRRLRGSVPPGEPIQGF